MVVPDLDLLEPERIDIPDRPDHLPGLADQPCRYAHSLLCHVLLQHRQAERMEGADRKIREGDCLFQPFRHLTRGFLRERERENLFLCRSMGEQVENLLHDDPRLP